MSKADALLCSVINAPCHHYRYELDEAGKLITEYCYHIRNISTQNYNCIKEFCPLVDMLANPPVKTATDFLTSAAETLSERGATYDSPEGERNAGKTAIAFNAITGKTLTESEIWLILQLLKDVRQWSRVAYHEDSALDCVSYAALKAEALAKRQ